MKKAKFSDSQIISILKQVSAGTPIAEVLRGSRAYLQQPSINSVLSTVVWTYQ